jgi:hypothetical protein
MIRTGFGLALLATACLLTSAASAHAACLQFAETIAIQQLELAGCQAFDPSPAVKDFDTGPEIGVFEKVPPESPGYLNAQFRLGQLLTDAAQRIRDLPQDEGPAPESVPSRQERIKALQTRAWDVLSKALVAAESKLGANEPLTESMASAKLCLAEIANQTDRFGVALQLLKTDKRSVKSYVSIKAGEVQSETEAQKAKFAIAVHTQVVRACLGLKDLDRTLESLPEWEKLALVNDKESLRICNEIGLQLIAELNQQERTNRIKYDADLKSLEQLVGAALARQTGQSQDLLSGLGVMCSTIGQNLNSRAASTRIHLMSVQAYRVLIAKGTAESAFCTKSQLLSAKVCLAGCQREAGELTSALKSITELIRESPDELAVQLEAARIFQARGDTGDVNSEKFKNWTIATLGDDAGLKVQARIGMWGWSKLYHKLEAIEKEPDRFQNEILEARYDIVFFRYQSGLYEWGPKRRSILNSPYAEVFQIAYEYPLNAKQYARFNTLYRRIALALGAPLEDLPKSEVVPGPAAVSDN